MTVFERPDDRAVVLLSSGNLAGTQAVISVLKQRGESKEEGVASIWSARTMFDVAMLVSDAVRDVERRDGKQLATSSSPFNASFIIGGQIKGDSLRLFRTFAEGNFIEASVDTPFFQTGEAKYGKPIIDRVITPSTSLSDAMKCVLVSFDSTMRSNLSVGMPIDLASANGHAQVQRSNPLRARRRLFQHSEQRVERGRPHRVPSFAQVRKLIFLCNPRATTNLDVTVRVGCSLVYEVTGTASLLLNLKLRPDRNHAVLFEALALGNNLPAEEFSDSHGNCVCRVKLAPGTNCFRHDAIVAVSSQPDNHDLVATVPQARAISPPRCCGIRCPADIATPTS